jgi:ribosome-dependent ATPase
VAVDAVSLDIPLGSATALVGPDGVGKSTILGLLAGIKRVQSGTVEVLGDDMASPAHRDVVAARIAYMPQGLGRNLYPTLTVFENLDFFGRLFGQPRVARMARIEGLLRATGLDPFYRRAVGKLSGGMKQKLALCCALIHDPDLLVLDEPTTGVDPLSRRQFWTLIDAIRAARPGMTLVAATAYMEEAERFPQLIAVDRGRILASGRTADVIANADASSLEDAYVALTQGGTSRQATRYSPPPRAPGPHETAIAAENLTRRFGAFVAVDHVSFRIERGEIFGFLGSNGCGKTTTMKMLTGLLAPDEGRAYLLGRPMDGGDAKTRMRVGYMSQSFSLYEELTVRANLNLHARLYRLRAAEADARVTDALQRFQLAEVADQRPDGLPLGLRQRLQLAVACLHRPEVLILDEPTSGVDPEARTMFWHLLAQLAREEAVTIFISTHFMNEAERCDRISLMHAGRVLAIGTPDELRRQQHASTLEDAFVSFLEEAAATDGATPRPGPEMPAWDGGGTTVTQKPERDHLSLSFGRIWAFARREFAEILRDRVRLAFALISPLILMLAFGYGITFDVEELPFAVLDRDQSLESRQLIDGFTGSRYFQVHPPLHGEAEIDRRLRSGELRVSIEIPPGFGRDLLERRRPEVGVFLDGSNPFRAETARAYVQGTVLRYVEDLSVRMGDVSSAAAPFRIETRFRYNQDFRSVFAITPGVIMILTLLIPAMLTALAVVREKEIGSISNLYASPASVGEFLLGKQATYLVIGFLSFTLLLALVQLVFGLEIKGSVTGLLSGGALYVFAATALGLFISAFVRTQVAAIIVTAIVCVVPAVNFSGFLYPASTIEGAGRLIGQAFPALWFQSISVGALAKARTFEAMLPNHIALLAFGVTYLVAARLMLRKQAT